MSKLYIDCSMGAAGDMLMASLYELIDDKEAFLNKMHSLGIPKVEIIPQKKLSKGISGTSIKVLINGEEENTKIDSKADHGHSHENGHHHAHFYETRGLKEITDLINKLDLPDKVKEDSVKIFSLISQVESIVHDTPMEYIHFHEVGTYDAVVDIVGSCLLMNMLGYPQVTASPVHVGSGTVKCAHGILPVPAPATALILKGVPIYGGEIKAELCTPTGAAILKYYVKEFGPMPPMVIEKIGYGIGTKEFERSNALRIVLGK